MVDNYLQKNVDRSEQKLDLEAQREKEQYKKKIENCIQDLLSNLEDNQFSKGYRRLRNLTFKLKDIEQKKIEDCLSKKERKEYMDEYILIVTKFIEKKWLNNLTSSQKSAFLNSLSYINGILDIDINDFHQAVINISKAKLNNKSFDSKDNLDISEKKFENRLDMITNKLFHITHNLN